MVCHISGAFRVPCSCCLSSLHANRNKLLTGCWELCSFLMLEIQLLVLYEKQLVLFQNVHVHSEALLF